MSDYKEKHLEKKNHILKCLSEAEAFFKENEFEHEAQVIVDNMKKLNVESLVLQL